MSSPTFEDVKLSTLIQPTPKQLLCIRATDKYRFVLYGGGAGGGKSYVLRWWCLRQLLKRYAETGIPSLMAGLFSIDYPTLQDRQISKIEREFPAWLGSTRRTEKEGLCFFLKPEFGAGRIALRNLSDATSYKSAEFCDIAIEELTENQRDVFEDLVLFRLRTPGIERPCFLAGTNPTGRGLQWVKGLWVDRKIPPELAHLKDEFHYVPALLEDNPYINAVYRDSLKGLPEKKRKALLDGDWTVPEGQYFTNFEPSERRVSAAIIQQIVQPWWAHWISQDWGYKHHTPIHWHAVGNVLPDQAKLMGRTWMEPKRCVFTYREHVVSLADKQMSEDELGQIVGQLSASEKISRHVLSKDAFGEKTSQKTPATMIGEATKKYGLPAPVPCDMKPGSRIVGWRHMHSLIQNDSWFLSDRCPEALDAIPALEYDSEKGGEDILKTDHIYDDIGDELRYGLQDMLNLARKPYDVELAERIAATKDPFEQHFMRLAETERRQRLQQGHKNYWDD